MEGRLSPCEWNKSLLFAALRLETWGAITKAYALQTVVNIKVCMLSDEFLSCFHQILNIIFPF